MLYCPNHATNLGRIIVNDSSPHLSQPERLNSTFLWLFSINRTSYLSDFQSCHVNVSSFLTRLLLFFAILKLLLAGTQAQQAIHCRLDYVEWITTA
jgi:hypothetical protein